MNVKFVSIRPNMRWHRRWFILRSNNGLSTLEYYKDEKSKAPIKVINLDECDQVDEGLTFSAKPAFGFIFDLKTKDRKYFLVAESEEEMSRWVQQICNVCGFFSEENPEEEEDTSPYSPSPDPGLPMLPVQSADPVLNTHPESQAMIPPLETNGILQHDTVPPEDRNDSYLKLWVENGDIQNGHTDMGERTASVPELPPPSPPKEIYSVPRNQSTYDVPPPPVSWNAPVYDIPPSSRFVEDVRAMEDKDVEHPIYKAVPRRSTSVDVPSRNFEQQISQTNCDGDDSFGHTLEDDDDDDGDEDDSPYQVPPNNQSVLNHRLLVHLTNDDVSKSTDDLAQKFKLISQSNQARPVNTGSESENIYINDVQRNVNQDVPPRPPKPPSLTMSEANSLSSVVSPFRQQDDCVFDSYPMCYEPMVANQPYKSPPIKAPPRPPKPDSLRNNNSGPATPPPSFEDSFAHSRQTGISPRQLEGRLSETVAFDDLYAPMSATNTRSPSLSFVSSNGSISLEQFYPSTRKESGEGYLNLRDDEKCSITSPSCLVSGGFYMPMQGTANPSPSFTKPTTDTHYLPMQSSLDDTTDDYYAGLREQPRVPPHSVPPPPVRAPVRHSSVPQRLVPPPVDRSIKPNRIESDSMGMHGSYYATDVEVPRMDRKTRSFHKTREHR
ncbi:GRB2-associated-binding protein 1-like isoform X1 [Anneissia japonica]|uniref:GRB2-associated-binding protein 1-like isoform X1 n=2 Tax=Anneissia japonica TaxID=1529436 RepID=UPI0014255A17|nr:GRB2-associated-binding protein 1-like isoform X1 [Anneissia japonica]